MTNFEIRANIKFLIKLNWKPVAIIEALQKVYGVSAPCRAVVYDGLNALKKERRSLMMPHEKEDPQHKKMKKTSGLCRT